jgi:invasion protein IalB
MKNTKIVLAGVGALLVVALLAVWRFGFPSQVKTATAAPPPPTPSEVAAAVKGDFQGHVKIGDWRLNCGKGRALPTPPSNQGERKSHGKNGPPPGWRIPRCQVSLGLRNPKDIGEGLRISFRLFGFKRVLGIFLRLPPSAVETGDAIVLRVDNAERSIPVRACAAQFCLAIDSVKFVDVPSIEAAKKMMVIFTPTGSGQAIAIPVPTRGLAEALKTQRRIDK